jgi:hypothetical protein
LPVAKVSSVCIEILHRFQWRVLLLAGWCQFECTEGFVCLLAETDVWVKLYHPACRVARNCLYWRSILVQVVFELQVTKFASACRSNRSFFQRGYDLVVERFQSSFSDVSLCLQRGS